MPLWDTKNSQDYLHYLSHEVDNFNLILAPTLVEMYSNMANERGMGYQSDYSYFAIVTLTLMRCMLLAFYMYVVTWRKDK